MELRAIIFDWARTLYDSDADREFPESARVLAEGQRLKYFHYPSVV